MTMYPHRARGLKPPRLRSREPYLSKSERELAELQAYIDELDEKDFDGTTNRLIEAGILYRQPDGTVTLPPLDPPRLIAVFF
jgi:hypothetical protein